MPDFDLTTQQAASADRRVTAAACRTAGADCDAGPRIVAQRVRTARARRLTVTGAQAWTGGEEVLAKMKRRLISTRVIKRIAGEYDIKHDAGVLSPAFREPILERKYLAKWELLDIVRWKTDRRIDLAEENSAIEVKRITRQAFGAARRGRINEAVKVLCGLRGVQVRMASAILMVWNPERYTVMDEYACKALRDLDVGYMRTSYTAGTYATYLDACTKLAKKHDVDLRTLDRYLWVKGQGK